MDKNVAQRGNTSTAMIWVVVIFAIIAAGTWAVYEYGEAGQVVVNGRTLEDLEWWEVAGAVVIGMMGLVIGLVGGAIGLVIGLIGAVIALVVGLIGVAAGLFITAGVLLGPFLLLAAIILLFRRRGGSGGSSAALCDTHGLDCPGGH